MKTEKDKKIIGIDRSNGKDKSIEVTGTINQKTGIIKIIKVREIK